MSIKILEINIEGLYRKLAALEVEREKIEDDIEYVEKELEDKLKKLGVIYANSTSR